MEDYFNKLKDLSVLVIGDLMIDKYLFCDVDKISPEAPVPVARFIEEEYKLGGAANVALNLASLGVNTSLFGLCGEDENKKVIYDICNKKNIAFFPYIENSFTTISKVRIVSKKSQMLRLDYEQRDYKSNSKAIITSLKKIVDKFDVIIISDYQKGLLSQEVINYLGTLDKYVSIDIKPGSFTLNRNFSLMKPNFKEAFGIAKELGFEGKCENSNENCESICNFIYSIYKIPLLVTRSEMGVSYFDGKLFQHMKTEISEVIDVTGAGDTCISIFSVLDYLEMDKVSALQVMNAAAKVAVSHFSTYAPTINEIKTELYKEDFTNIYTYESIFLLIEQLKKKDKKIVFTNGCFDLLHRGHVSYLSEAKKLGDILIVGINSDSSVKKLKGDSRPIIDEQSRAYILSNLKVVDYVCIFEEENPIKLINLIQPNIHVKGGDYNVKEMIETSYVEKYGGEVRIIPFIKGNSTTEIANRIKKNG